MLQKEDLPRAVYFGTMGSPSDQEIGKIAEEIDKTFGEKEIIGIIIYHHCFSRRYIFVTFRLEKLPIMNNFNLTYVLTCIAKKKKF